MEDHQYKLQIESCFKQVETYNPNVSDEINNIVQQNKEKKREEIRKKLYENHMKKIYGNKVKLQQVPVDKRKQAVMERLHKKLELKKNFQ